MGFPSIKRRFAGLLRHIPGVWPARFVDNKNDQPEKLSGQGGGKECPFILVAHSENGRWDVYSGNFDNPLATFDQRQECCDFANNLAMKKADSIVLIRDTQINL